MTIGIDGTFIFSLSIGSNTDFLTEDDLEEFTVIEKAGNVLPEYILNFKSTEDKILRQLNEGTILKAQFGRDSSSLQDINLSTSTLKTVKENADQTYYETKGFASAINYITDHSIQITSSKSGIAAALEAAGKSFKTEGGLSTSLDSQKWIQYGISNKGFVNNCLLHADLGSSAPIYAITADGKFVLKDLNQTIRLPHKWKFARGTFDPRDIEYDADPMIESKAGFINNWLGYGKQLYVNMFESGAVNIVQEDPVAIMADKLDKDSSIGKRYGGSRLQSENVHANYWKAANHNLQTLAILSKVEVAVSFTGNFRDIQPLDVVMYATEDSKSILAASEEKSGKYLVTAVSRSIQKSQLITTVLLNRDAFNQVK